jgi:hypothetical protein
VLINEGQGYDTKSGIFTAPTNGLYHFTAHVCNTHALVIHYAIVKDGEWIARSQQFEQADEIQTNMPAVVLLAPLQGWKQAIKFG